MMQKLTRRNKIMLIAALCFIMILLPVFIKDAYIKDTLIRVMMFSILTSSLNLTNGYGGMFSLGISGLMCIGSYVEAILSTRFGISFWILMPLSGLIAACVGLLIALPAIRLRGIYFAIISLGLSEIIRLIAQNWTSVTGGAMGIKCIPSPTLFGFSLSSVNSYYYIIFFLLLLCVLSIKNLMNSSIGRAWLSIREDDMASQSLGVNQLTYKSLNLFVASFWAGVAGAFMAPYLQYVAADMYTTDVNFDVLSMLIIGGQGTIAGPIIGSLVANVLSEGMRQFFQWRLVIYSIIILVTMWFRPQGIAGSSSASLTGIVKRKSKKEAAG